MVTLTEQSVSAPQTTFVLKNLTGLSTGPRSSSSRTTDLLSGLSEDYPKMMPLVPDAGAINQRADARLLDMLMTSAIHRPDRVVFPWVFCHTLIH